MADDTTRTISDYDLMVLVSFETKAEWEGDEHYTYENWPPEFETADLNERAGTYGGFMEILRENADALTAWNDAHTEDACDLINAHRDEEKRRAEHAMLWAVRRGFDQAVFPQRTAAMALWFFRPDGIYTWTLLRRDEPGGEWVETTPEAVSASV